MPPRRFARKRGRYAPRRTGKFGARIRRGVTRRIGNYGRFNRVSKMGRYQRSSNVELKLFDNVSQSGNCAAQGQAIGSFLVTTVNTMGGTGLEQSSRVNGRLGNKVTIKSIELKGYFVPTIIGAGTFVNVGGFTTLYLVLDTQANGAVPFTANGTAAGSDCTPLLAYVNATTGTWTEGVDTFQFRNLSNTGRFRVLKKKNIQFFSFSNIDTTHLAFKPQQIDWYMKCNIPIEYDTAGAVATGTIGTIKTNNLFWCLSAGSGYDLTYTFSSRIRYADC